MNNTVETIAQRLRELSDRTTDRHSRSLGSFNHLQQVESLAHDLRALTPENYVAAGALLFSPSVRYNALDYCDLALKSRDMTKDLIDTRARLYEALAEFIARAGANGVQDHLVEIRKHTIDWLRNENSSKSKLAALEPLKACLQSKSISFTDEFDPASLAALFKDRFSYGKANEFYSNGVKGALLTLLGMMCARFGSVFNTKDKNEPPTSKETLGGSIRRLCLFTLEEQYKGETKDPNSTLQAGALSGLRFTLETCPFETGSDSEEAKRVYRYVRAFMQAPPDMRRYEVPVQAILLLRDHANLLGPQLVTEAIQVFNDLRDLWARSDRIRRVASGACTEVLRVIAKAVSYNGTEAEDDGEEEADQSEDKDDSEEEDDGTSFPSQSKTSKLNVPVALDADARKKVLNVFMRRFFEFIQTALKSGGAEPDRDKRRALRNDVDLAITGFGLFSQAVVALIDEKRLRQVLDKLFELSDRLNAAEDEVEEVSLEEKLEEGSVSTRPEWMRRNLVNEKTKRRVRFLTTYASMAKHLAVESLAEDSIISRFANEIIELSRHLRIFPQYLTLDFTTAVSKLLRALANRGSAMQNLLSKVIHPVLMQSIGSSAILDDQDTLVFDQFWRRLLPNKTDERKKVAESGNTNLLAKTLVFDHLLAVSLKLLSRLNVECTVMDQAETLDDMQPTSSYSSSPSTKSSSEEEKEQKKEDDIFLTTSSAAMIHSVDRVVPNSVDDLVLLHNLTRLFEQVMPHCHPSHLTNWLPLYSRSIVQGLERNPLLSGWYWLMSLGFVALDGIVAQGSSLPQLLDVQTEQCLDDFIETSALRSKQYRDELLAASLSCVIKAPRGRSLEKHIRSLAPCMVAALRMGLSYPPIAKDALIELERWTIVVPTGILVPLYPTLLRELSGYLSTAGGKSSKTGGAIAQQQGASEEDEAEAGEEGKQQDDTNSASREEDEDLKRQWLVSQSKSRKQALKSARRHLIEQARNGEDDLSLGLRAVRILGRIGGNSRFVIPPIVEVLKDARRWDPVSRLDVSLHLGSFVVPVVLDVILPRVTHLARTSTHRQTKIAACELLHTLVIIMVGTAASEQSKSGDHFFHLYTHLIPELLRLAVDVEPVAKQLFRPLIAQLARWFSRDLSVERPETIVLLDAAIDALSDHSNGSLRELAADTLAVFFRWTLKSASGTKGAAAKKQRISVSSSLNVQAMLHRLYALMRHPDPFKRLGSALAFGAIYKDFREENSLVSEHALQLLENSVIALRMADADSEALGTRQAASEVAMRVLRIVHQKASDLVEEKEDRVGFTNLKEAVEWLFTMCHAREPLLRARSQEMFQVLAPHIVSGGKNPLHEWFSKFGGAGVEAMSSDLKHISTLEDVNKLEEATAFIDFHLWLVRTRMIEKDQKDSLNSAFQLIDQLMSLIASNAEKTVDEQESNEKGNLLPHRSSIALAKLSRISIEFMTQNIHQALKQHESTVGHVLRSGSLLLLRPQLVGMDAEDREIKMLFPPAFQRLIGVLDKEGNMSLLNKSIASLVSSKMVLISEIDFSDADSASLLRGLVHLVRSSVKLGDMDKKFHIEQFTRRIQQIKPGSGPLTLRNGSSGLRLCLEAGLDRAFLVELALDTTPVESKNAENDGPKVGAVFMEHFEEELIRHLVREPSGLIAVLLSKIDASAPTGANASTQAFRLLNSLCDQLILNGTKQAISSFADEAVPKLKSFRGDASNLELVQLVAKILQLLTMVELKVRSKRIEDALETTMALLKNSAKRASVSQGEVLSLRMAIIRGCIPPLLSGAVEVDSSEARAADLNGGLNFGLQSQSTGDVYPVVLPSHEQKLLEFLEKEIVSAYFPPNAGRMSPHTPEADSYLKVLSAMFEVLSTTGSVGMLRILFRAVREFEADVHRDTITEGLKKFAARVDCQVYEPSKDHLELPCMDIVAECVRSLLKDAPDFAKHSRLPLFNLVFVSIAQRLSSKAWEILLTTKGRICGKEHPDQTILGVLLGVVENPLESEPSKQCAFTAFRSLYESAQVDTLQTIQRTVFPPDKDKPTAPSNKLTTELSKHAVQVLSTAAKRVLHGKRDFALESGSNTANSWGNNPPGGAARGQDLVRALSASELYHNAVYSCLVAVVCRTQSKVNIYEKLLFGDTVSDWWHVLIPMRVDAATEPAYSVENPARPSTTIRSRLTMSGLLEEHQVATRRLTTSGISTSSATQIFSSLAVEDDSLQSTHERAVVSDARARPPVPVFTSGGSSSTTTTTTTTTTITEVQQPLSERERQCLADEVAPLELDAINSLPAMTALLTTLDSCRRKKIITVEGDIGSQSSTPIPSWVRMVLDAIKDLRGFGGDARQSLNIRVFGARAVLNRPSLFEPWARQFVIPLLQLCLDMETPYVEDPSRTRGLHSFLMEVIQLLLVWDVRNKNILKLDSENLNAWRLVSKLVSMLARLSPSNALPVMRANVQLVSALISVWKGPRLEIQGTALLTMCRNEESSTRESSSSRSGASIKSCGLSLFLACAQHYPDLPLIPSDVSEADFFETLFDILKRSRVRTVRSGAADVLALALAGGRYPDRMNRLHEIVDDLQRVEDEHDKWLEICATMATSQRAEALGDLLTRGQINRLQGILSRLEGDFLRMGMQIIVFLAKTNKDKDVTCAELYRSIIPVLNASKVLSPTNPHVGSIIGTLDAVELLTRVAGDKNGFLPSLVLVKDGWIESIFALATTHGSSRVREKCLQYLAGLVQDHPDHLFSVGRVTPNQAEEEEDEVDETMRLPSEVALGDKVRCVLLAGLSDPNPVVQKRVFEIWDANEKHLPGSSPLARLVSCLSSLAPSSKWFVSTEAGSKILRRVESNWASQVAQLILVLTRRSAEYENVKSSLVFKDPLDASAIPSQVVDIDAYDFGSARASDSLVQPLFVSSQATMASQYVVAGSSQAIGGGDMLVKATQQANLQFAPTQQAMGMPTSGGMPGGGPSNFRLAPVSRLLSQTQSNVLAASRPRPNQPTKRRVVVLRRYRKGELPDIQIPRRDLMEPLLALCGLDAQIAEDVLTTLSKALFQRAMDKTEQHKAFFGSLTPDREQILAKTRDSLSVLLQSALRSRGGPDTSYVSCLLDMSSMVADEAFSKGITSNLEVPARILGMASLASGSLAKGVTNLESIILRARTTSEPMKGGASAVKHGKRAKADAEAAAIAAQTEEEAWDELLALYERLNDEDIMRGLIERASQLEETRRAMQMEMAGEQTRALKLYKDILARDVVSSKERILAWSGRSRSLYSLRRWDDCFKEMAQLVREVMESEKDYQEKLGEDDLLMAEEAFFGSHQNRALKRQLKQFVGSGVRSTEHQAFTIKFVDQCLQETSTTAFLESQLPQELILSELCRKQGPNWGQAQKTADSALRRFLIDYGAQSNLATATRSMLLRPLQPLTEFADAFEARRQCASNKWTSPAPMEKVLSSWETSSPSPTLDSISLEWEAALMNRTLLTQLVYMDAMNAHNRGGSSSSSSKHSSLSAETVSVWEDFKDRSERMKLQLVRETFDAALVQNRLDEAHSVMEQLRGMADKADSTSARDRLQLALNDMHVDYILADKRGAVDEHQSKLGRAFERLKKHKNDSLDYLQRISRVTMELSLNGNTSVLKDAFDFLGQTVMKLEHIGSSSPSSTESSSNAKQLAQARYDLGSFAEKMLSSQSNRDELAEIAVKNLLSAMRMGHGDAINTFPSLLSLVVGASPASKQRKAFDSLAPDCATPTVLLRWTAQLLSFIEQSDLVDELLTKLAKTFPQSLYYPFRVAREALEERGSDPKVLARMDKLERAMDLPPVVKEFCNSLENLNNPELRLKDACKSIGTLLGTAEKIKASDSKQAAAILKTAKEMYRNKVVKGVFEVDPKKSGSYNVDFAKKYKDDFVLSEKDIKWTSAYFTQLAHTNFDYNRRPGKLPLATFSRWLDGFAIGLDPSTKGELEVPGWRDPWHASVNRESNEYESSGGGAGIPSESDREFYLVKSFDSEVLQLSSMRVPKRLTMRGVDGKRRDFLVKGGEDLRLDERIEQIFSFMNSLMEADGDCAKRNLKIQTYRVIPVSLSIGLIEWVPDSEPVRNVIISQGRRSFSMPANINDWSSAKVADTWYTKYRVRPNELSPNVPKLYGEDDEKCAEAYREMISRTPADLLRRHFVSISSGAEAFLALRQVFAQSLASISMSCYVLGIGDRHLENFLLGPCGDLIAIDFGYSFGIGVAMLPVPETTPFRFTPQFSQFFAPLDSKGTFFQCSTSVMQCLRTNRRRVMDVLDVFVKEPLVDWVQHAQIMSGDSSGGAADSSGHSSSDQETWRPLVESRVRVADLKMRGVRPSLVMTAELKERRSKKGLESVIGAVCRASGEDKFTMQESKHVSLRDGDSAPWIADPLSVHDQISELVRMATEPALLARQWQMAYHWL